MGRGRNGGGGEVGGERWGQVAGSGGTRWRGVVGPVEVGGVHNA